MSINQTCMKEKREENFIRNTQNQSSNFRTKNWVELNDDSCGTHNTNSQIKIKTLRKKFRLLQGCIYTCEWSYNNC